jgi:hypothetical protein
MVQPSHPSMSDYWIGPSEAMQPILERLLDIARANAPVRITGEFGTGRTALAHLIHHSGPRVHGPFLLSLFDRSPWARRRTFSPPPSKPWFASQELAAPCTVYLQHIERLGPDEQEILEDVLDHKEVQTGPTPGDRVESKARVIRGAERLDD